MSRYIHCDASCVRLLKNQVIHQAELSGYKRTQLHFLPALPPAMLCGLCLPHSFSGTVRTVLRGGTEMGCPAEIKISVSHLVSWSSPPSPGQWLEATVGTGTGLGSVFLVASLLLPCLLLLCSVLETGKVT